MPCVTLALLQHSTRALHRQYEASRSFFCDSVASLPCVCVVAVAPFGRTAALQQLDAINTAVLRPLLPTQ